MRETEVCHMLSRECHFSGVGRMRVTLDRFQVTQRGHDVWLTSRGERLYVLLDARGSLSVKGAGACWKYRLAPNMAIWMPQGVEHALRNAGDAPLRGILFDATFDAPIPTPAKRENATPEVIHLLELPQKSMVTFLTRTAFRNEHSGTGALLLSEVQTVLPGGHGPLHLHEARTELCYVLCGSGILTRQEEAQAVRAGEAALIPPGVAHSMANDNDEVLEYVIAQFVDEQGSSSRRPIRTEEKL